MMDALNKMKDPNDPEEQKNSIIPEEVFEAASGDKGKRLQKEAAEGVKRGRMLGTNDMDGIGEELAGDLKKAAKKCGNTEVEEQVVKHGVVFVVKTPDGTMTREPPTADPNAFEIPVSYKDRHYSSVDDGKITPGNVGKNDCLLVAAMEVITAKTGIDLGKEDPNYVGGLRGRYADSMMASNKAALRGIIAQKLGADKSKRLKEGGNIAITIPDDVFERLAYFIIQIEEIRDAFMKQNGRKDLKKLAIAVKAKARQKGSDGRYQDVKEKLESGDEEKVYSGIAKLFEIEIELFEATCLAPKNTLLVKTKPTLGKIIQIYHQEHEITTKNFGSVSSRIIKGIHCVGGSMAQTLIGHGRPKLSGLTERGNTVLSGINLQNARIRNFTFEARQRHETLALIQEYYGDNREDIDISAAVQRSDNAMLLYNIVLTENDFSVNFCVWNLHTQKLSGKKRKKPNTKKNAKKQQLHKPNRITSEDFFSPIMTTLYRRKYFKGNTHTLKNGRIENAIFGALKNKELAHAKVAVFEGEEKTKMILLIDTQTKAVKKIAVLKAK
ncbi:MAG: uncharacterized protein A8A55_2175 [Amphiamblys sp. WSBS2006]|nr:MAG: uncharacterized protein A8A55_2175 [Amphiamblys sp. WSBS2006]